jgi:hypothetical protein
VSWLAVWQLAAVVARVRQARVPRTDRPVPAQRALVPTVQGPALSQQAVAQRTDQRAELLPRELAAPGPLLLQQGVVPRTDRPVPVQRALVPAVPRPALLQQEVARRTDRRAELLALETNAWGLALAPALLRPAAASQVPAQQDVVPGPARFRPLGVAPSAARQPARTDWSYPVQLHREQLPVRQERRVCHVIPRLAFAEPAHSGRDLARAAGPG